MAVKYSMQLIIAQFRKNLIKATSKMTKNEDGVNGFELSMEFPKKHWEVDNKNPRKVIVTFKGDT